MRKTVWVVCFLLLVHGFAWANAPATQPTTGPAVMESEAVREGGMDFQIVASTVWAKPTEQTPTRVLLGLKVTNRTDGPRQLNLWSPIGIVDFRIKDAVGNHLWVTGMLPDHAPDPRLVPQGQSIMLDRTATLSVQEGATMPPPGTVIRPEDLKPKLGMLELVIPDEARGWQLSQGLRPGRYTICLTYQSREAAVKAILSNPSLHIVDPKDAPFWIGKRVITKELVIEITD